MKKFSVIAVFALLSIVTTSCDNKKKQDEDKKAATEEVQKEVKPEVKKENVVGGWSAMEVDDKVKEIAAFVVKDKGVESKVEKITDASSQVVSGRNFKFKLHLENGEVWEAQVYENLQDEKKVTLFEKLS